MEKDRESFQYANGFGYEWDTSGIRAFNRVIGFAVKYSGRKIGFTSRGKLNRRKVWANIIGPAKADKSRQPVRNPVEIALDDPRIEKIVEDFGDSIIEAAFNAMDNAGSQGGKGFYSGHVSGPIKKVYEKSASKIADLIRDSFDKVEPLKTEKGHKDTSGLVETGKLKQSVSHQVYGKPRVISRSSFAIKKRRGKNARKRKPL